MTTWEEFLEKQMVDPEFRREYERQFPGLLDAMG